MQTLYAISTLEKYPGDAVKILQKHFEQTRQLFIYLIYFLSEVARFAEADAQIRVSKHLPTFEDLHVNTKIAGNEVLAKVAEDASFKEFEKKDKEVVKKNLPRTGRHQGIQEIYLFPGTGQKRRKRNTRIYS